jgi:cytochrome c-type biogenesis protein
MRYKKIMIIAVLLLPIALLSGCLDGGTETQSAPSYELMSGMTMKETGYSGDPDNGNQPSSQALEVGFMENMIVEAEFTLIWDDDAPQSEPDEFELEVSGMMAGSEKTFTERGSSGELKISIKANDFSLDSFDGDSETLLGTTWKVTVSAISCGSTPLLPIGPGLVLNDPDEGNEWELETDSEHIMEMRKSGGGGAAPDFTVMDTDGEDVSLSQFDGEVVILDLMMRCGACEDQIKELKKIQNRFGDQINILSIDIDSGDSMEDVKEMKEEHGADWIFAMDSDNLKTKYKVTGMRKLVIVDINNKITFTSDDVVNEGDLSSEIDTAISGKGEAIALSSSGLFAIAFLTGITAFFAPCAFPMLPGYVTYYMGTHGSEGIENEIPHDVDRKKLLKKGLLTGAITGLGIAVVYLLFGLLLSTFGAAASSVMSYLAPIIAIIVIVIGLTFILDIPINLEMYFYRLRKAVGLESRYSQWKDKRGIDAQNQPQEGLRTKYRGLFYYGFGYGAASTGCHGVAFVSIVLVGLASGGFGGAMGASFLWVIGMAMIMVIVTILLALAKDDLIKKITKNIGKINKITGFLLILSGIIIIFYLM